VKGMKVCFWTIGCKVNQAESEAMAQLAEAEGYEVVDESGNPDVLVINTCTVTGTGSSKSRKLIRRVVRDYPRGIVAVMGCYAQVNPEEIAGLGVDIILGTQDRRLLFQYLKNIRLEKSSREESGIKEGVRNREAVRAVRDFGNNPDYEELGLVKNENRARAMLKIQDGCSQFCSYCIVPYARGPARSRDEKNILKEAELLLESGYREIVLTGVHIGAYGKDCGNLSLASLISRLLALKGMHRLRLGSIEPMEFTPELLEIIAHPAVCPHFHIPLQSGSDTVLARMKRPYTVKEYAAILYKIREKLPRAAIAADIMTGFPGETEQEHRESLAFVSTCDFAGLHVFPYSRRPGTPAAEMPGQLAKNIKTDRVRDFLKIAENGKKKYARKFIGETLEILLEKIEADGSAVGHSRNYLELKLPPSLNIGRLQVGDLVHCPVKEDYILF